VAPVHQGKKVRNATGRNVISPETLGKNTVITTLTKLEFESEPPRAKFRKKMRNLLIFRDISRHMQNFAKFH
jgi:hypothetical protein